MAGGRGERFWPKSRNAHPKQLLNLLGKQNMLEMTVDRLHPLVPADQIIVLANRGYINQVRSALPHITPNNIFAEPVARDTGPCIALAAALIAARGGSNAVMLVLPSDHAINPPETLRETLQDIVNQAASHPRWLYTIGIKPTRPANEYGYIRCGDPIQTNTATRFFKGLGFKEKPDITTAKQFIADGCYRWNSGIFIWQVSALVQAFEQHAPALADLFHDLLRMAQQGTIESELAGRFERAPRISIDYAVMEKATHIGVAESRFEWDDVGSWTALRNHLKPDSKGNLIDGLFAGIDCRNLTISGQPDHLIATIGVENLVIVQTQDATLICHSDQAQRIKELLKLADDRPELTKFL